METNTPPGIKDKIQTTGRQERQKLRNVVSPPGKKGLWLRKLNDRQLSEVYHRLKMGQAPYRVVKIAQVDWGVMRKSQPASLNRGMVVFRDKVVGEITAEAGRHNKEEKKRFNAVATRKGARSVEKLNSLGRLRWLINTQTERLVLLRSKEKSTNMPLMMTEKTVEVLGGLLENLIKHEIALGLRDAKPSELSTSVKNYFDAMLRKVDGDPLTGGSGGNVMISAANKMLEAVSKDAVLMTINEDGGYDIADAAESGESETGSV